MKQVCLVLITSLFTWTPSLQQQLFSNTSAEIEFSAELNEMSEPTTGSRYDYNGPLQSSTFFLAEHFFEDYHNAVNRVALLKSIGFTEAAIVYSEQGKFDVAAGLYIIMITRPVSDVSVLYDMMEPLRAHAIEHGYHLHTTRMVKVL